MAKSRVLLVGAGGIGTVAALNLEHGGLASVSCVLRSNFEVVNQNGFTIDSCDHGQLEHWKPTEILKSIPAADSSNPFDYIVCCTKNIADVSPSLVDIIAPAVTAKHTVIVLIQNGLNIERPILARFPDNIVLSGVSRADAHGIQSGYIQQKQPDVLNIGAFPHPTRAADDLKRAADDFVRVYSASGRTKCKHEPNVGLDRWTKLVYNACLNPICTLTGLDTGSLQLHEHSMQTLVRPAMHEVISLASAAGYSLPGDIIERTLAGNPIEQRIAPSMLVDLRKGNLIEHENILGEVVRKARALGVTTPVLTMLYNLCCSVQYRLKLARDIPS
ncbi:ketopantoate reductase PanE/ApbA C terminal-domain-containing protein [Aspergillus floccosus]